jgi:tetratricopeptide (TPR) repeat protein
LKKVEMKNISKYIRGICFGLLWVSLITGCASYRHKTLSLDTHLVQVTRSVQRAVVKITTYDAEKKRMGMGSGFFVDKDGGLITNYHVLDGAYAADVKTYDGREYQIQRVLAYNKTADLIKVKITIPENSVHWVEVTSDVPEIAERILVIGSPLGLDQTVSVGNVSAVREFPKIGKIFQMSAPTSRGSSGSPVINMHGKVIGVVSFIVEPGQNLNFAVAGQSVLDLKDEKTVMTLPEWTYRVSTQKPGLAAKLCKKGFEFSVQGKYKKALEYYREAAEKSPGDAESWFGLGSCYVGLKQPPEAIKAFEEAIRTSPDKTRAHYYLGKYYQSLDRYKEAIESYQRALEINRDYGPAYMGLAEIYSVQKRINDEKEAIEQLVQIHPDYASSHYNIGITYGKLGRYEDAIDAFKRALEIDPEIPEAYYHVGIIYGNLGKLKEEVAAYKQAIRIAPDFVPAHFNMGVFYLHAGRKDAAFEEYKILKKLNRKTADKLFDMIYK